MDITIIIDKSSFQMLKYDELLYVSSYYKHNITPVLVMEIVGDLKKETEGGKTPASDRVKDFARKLFPIYTVINTHYKKLVTADLLGDHPSLDGRPNVEVEKTVRSESGQKGQVIKITKEEESIYKWKDGDFTAADQVLSKLWRMTTTHENLLENLKTNLIEASGKPKIKDYKELNQIVEKILSSNETQEKLLHVLILNYEIDAESAVTIFGRWQIDGNPLLRDFAPYAFHCLKVDTLFLLGLTGDLITTRPTNRVDCEYLYYLPFCNVFTSNDKIHKNLVPLLLRKDQEFIVGEDLKKDMTLIDAYFKEKGEEERRKYKNEPPLIEGSKTFKLWKEYFNYPQQSNWNRNLSKQEFEMLKRKMDELEKASKSDSVEMKQGEETEFIIKESYLSWDDPCFCGSGKRVIECCIPPEQFKKIAKKK